MVATIKKVTTNLGMRIPIFDTAGWGRELERNFDVLDAAITAATGVSNVVGVWANTTAYTAGQRVVDEIDTTLYECLIGHTSASSGTFSADRSSNPTYWKAITTAVNYRGAWVTGTVYNINDVVFTDQHYAIASSAFTSGASLAADVAAGNFETIVNFTAEYADILAKQILAAANQTAAEAAQTASEAAQALSETAQGLSETAQTASELAETGSFAAQGAAEIAQAAAETAQGLAETAKTAAETAQSAAETAQTNTEAIYDAFDDRFLGAKASDPVLDNDGNALQTGAIYFNTTDNVSRIYDGADWQNIAGVQKSLNTYEYTATAAQTAFTGLDDNGANLSYILGGLIVTLNGSVLDPDDYTATDGSTITLASGATVGDTLVVLAFSSFNVADLTGITTDIIPASNSIYDLGSASNKFAELHATTANVEAMQGLDTINGGPLSSFRNKIINGDIRISQRGTSFSIAAGGAIYTADRWVIYNQTNQTATVGIVGSSLNAFADHGYPGYISISFAIAPTTGTVTIRQPVEGVETLSGKQVTIGAIFYPASNVGGQAISAQLRQYFGSGGSPSADVDIPVTLSQSTITTGAVASDIRGTVTLPTMSGKTLGTNNNDWLGVDFTYTPRTTEGVLFTHAFLVEGDATAEDDPFSPRHISVEERLCRRYFIAYTGESGLGFAPFGTGVSAGTSCFVICHQSAGMRTVPTATATGTISISDGAAGANLSSFAAIYKTQAGVWVSINMSGAITVGRGVLVYTQAASTNYAWLSAEL